MLILPCVWLVNDHRGSDVYLPVLASCQRSGESPVNGRGALLLMNIGESSMLSCLCYLFVVGRGVKVQKTSIVRVLPVSFFFSPPVCLACLNGLTRQIKTNRQNKEKPPSDSHDCRDMSMAKMNLIAPRNFSPAWRRQLPSVVCNVEVVK